MTEADLQRDAVSYLQTVPDIFFFAPQAEGFRNGKRAGWAKAMGLQAGIADIAILLPHGKTLWVEIKKHGGRQHENQRKFQEHCDRLGHRYELFIFKERHEVVPCFRRLLEGWGIC